MLLGSGQECVHHGGKLCHLDHAILGPVMLGEELQHKPVELQVLGTGGAGQGQGAKAAGVNDGLRVHGGGLSGNFLKLTIEHRVVPTTTTKTISSRQILTLQVF